MAQGTLIPNISEVALICLRPKDGLIQMLLRAYRSFSVCPVCGTASRRVHSRYLRKLADLPWEKLPVVILLQVRKFFCVETSVPVYGDFKDLDPNHPRVFSYTRTLNGEAYLIVHNVSSRPIEYTLPGNMKAGTTLLANYPSPEDSTTILHLKGWESRIYKQ
jgi:hypothetical protein